MAVEPLPSFGAFELVLVLSAGVSEHEMRVECKHEHDRQPASADDDGLIEGVWADRISRNPQLFNGTKFRFASVDAVNGGIDGVTLRLGVTDYKSFLGTNCAERWQQLLATSEAHLASPLGNAAIVETTDAHVVLIRRSGSVGECPHSIAMPGGHAEPEAVMVRSLEEWETFRSNDSSASDILSADWERSVRREIWDGMVREVVEETGVPRECLRPPLCIGFSRRVLNHRPDIIFFIQCSLPASAVVQCYATEAGVDRDETSELFTMERDAFVQQVLDEETLHMPGCHRGGVMLYREYLNHLRQQQ